MNKEARYIVDESFEKMAGMLGDAIRKNQEERELLKNPPKHSPLLRELTEGLRQQRISKDMEKTAPQMAKGLAAKSQQATRLANLGKLDKEIGTAKKVGAGAGLIGAGLIGVHALNKKRKANNVVNEAYEKTAGVKNFIGNVTGSNLKKATNVFNAAEQEAINFAKSKGGIENYSRIATNRANANNTLNAAKKATRNARIATGIGGAGIGGAGIGAYALRNKDNEYDNTMNNMY